MVTLDIETINLAKRADIDRMDRRNCRHKATAALRDGKAGMDAGFRERIFFDEGAAHAEGADRCMTKFAAEVGFNLTDAGSNTAGDVGAVHHDISPEARGTIKSRLWFL